MSQTDVELYRDVVEAWNRDDLDAMLETMSPDCEFQTAQLFSDTEPIYRGRDGFWEFWNTFRSAWEEIALDVERIEAAIPTARRYLRSTSRPRTWSRCRRRHRRRTCLGPRHRSACRPSFRP